MHDPILYISGEDKNFRTAPHFVIHANLIGDTLNNKAPYMDV